jgi:hypothetical protein
MKVFTKTIITLALAGAGCTAAARPAAAQSTGLVPLRVKVGVLLPQGGARDFAGSTHFDGEVDVRIPGLGAGNTYVTAGYSDGSKSGRHLRMIPLTISRLYGAPNPAAGVTGNVYFGVGAGAYFLRASGGGVSDSATRLGGFGVVGYQFPSRYFLEAKYHLVAGKVAGVRPNGLALMIGRTF